MTDDDPCGQCSHPLGPHVMVVLGESPLDGGIGLCPECDCAFTWSVPHHSRPGMPPPAVIAEIRAGMAGG
jgi:hypothetical protein